MSGVATAIVATSVYSSYQAGEAAEASAEASEEGARLERETAKENLAFQKELAEQQRGDFAPWRDIGKKSLDRLWAGVQSGEFDVGQVDVTKDPGYRYRMKEGIEALDASAAARGRLLSGSQKKALTKYGQDYGSNEFARAYARKSDEKARRYNMLSNLSQGGQASSAQQAQATSQLASTGGNIMSNLGRSQNIAQQDIGAARAGAYQGSAQAVNQGVQNWMLYDALK